MKVFGNVVKNTGKVISKVKGYKYTPKILMTVGIVTIVASGVYACKQTLKLEENIDEAKEAIDHVKDLKEKGEYVVNAETGETAEYTPALYRKDLAYAWANGIWTIAKPYIPSVFGTAFGIACICEGDKINTENLATVTLALNGLSQRFSSYRGNVKREYGEEVDQRMMTGQELKKNLEANVIDPETGEIVSKKMKKMDVVMDVNNIASPYAIILNDCAWWRGDVNYNEVCINARLDILQAMLTSKHYVYLYEIFEEFEILDRLSEEAIAMSHQVGVIEGFGDGDLRAKVNPSHLGSEDCFKDILIMDFNCIGGDYVDGKYISFNDLVSGRYWKRV